MFIREMRLDDIVEVAMIEQAHLSPWNEPQLREELNRKGGLQLVACLSPHKQEIVGWCCGFTLLDQAELLKIAVHPACLRKGWGQYLLHAFEAKVLSRKCCHVLLEVRSQNRKAIDFYLKNNYFQVGFRKRYYSSPGDDALLFKKDV